MNKQIAINIGANLSSFVVNLITSLLLTPYLIKHLGVAAYGLVPLALAFSMYVGLISQSITTSINKNIIDAVGDNNIKKVNEVISTAFIIFLAIVLLQVVASIYPVYKLESIISIPSALINDAKSMFVFVILGFSFNLISSVLSVSMYATNRLDLMQLNNILRNITRLIFTFLLFEYESISLASVGKGILFSAIISLIYSYVVSKILMKTMKIRVKYFKKSEVKMIFSMGIWVFVNQIGFVIFSKLDLALANFYFGAESAGLYAIIVQFSDLIKSFGAVIAGVTGPVIMIFASRGDIGKIINISTNSVKMLSMVLCIPIIFICVFFNEIIYIWLGIEDFEYQYIVWISIFPLILNLGVLPLFSVQVAMSKVKTPALVTLFFSIFSLLLSMTLIKVFDFGILAIAISVTLLLTIKNVVFTTVYAAKIMNLKWNVFIKPLISVLFYALIILIIYTLCNVNYRIHEFSQLLILFIMLSFVSIVISIPFFSKSDMNSLYKDIKGKIIK